MLQQNQRYKVTVRCDECGEKLILRGKLNKEGNYETGLKRCVCGNEEGLKIDGQPE